MTGMVAGVDFIGLLLAERLRRERGAELSAGAASLGGRFGFVWCHTRDSVHSNRAWVGRSLALSCARLLLRLCAC